jgi:hypothetical protein
MNEQFHKNENKEQNIKDHIMFSALSGGFSTNSKYGNQEMNYYSFDLRAYDKIMDLINKSQSFITTISRKDKSYIVAGLALNKNNTEVQKLSNRYGWLPGRNGYVFAVIEDTKNLPTDINEILTDEAIKSAKALFCEIKEWDTAIEKPTQIQ